MINSHIGKDRRGNDYNAMLFREVYQFISEAPTKLVEIFLESIENNDNEKALLLLEKFLGIQIPEKIKTQMASAVKTVYDELMGEPDVDWHKGDWDLVEGKEHVTENPVVKRNVKYPQKGFLPREVPYGMGKGKGYWKSSKADKIKQTGV
jgi:hypothetical protein